MIIWIFSPLEGHIFYLPKLLLERVLAAVKKTMKSFWVALDWRLVFRIRFFLFCLQMTRSSRRRACGRRTGPWSWPCGGLDDFCAERWWHMFLKMRVEAILFSSGVNVSASDGIISLCVCRRPLSCPLWSPSWKSSGSLWSPWSRRTSAQRSRTSDRTSLGTSTWMNRLAVHILLYRYYILRFLHLSLDTNCILMSQYSNDNKVKSNLI